MGGARRALVLDAGAVEAVVDADRGGRIASLRVDGNELLVGPDEVDGDPMLWGCYPMVPWAGRVRDGRFTFEGVVHELPTMAPPHAIHGVGHTSAWDVTGPTTLCLDLDGAWPFGGVVEQRFDLGTEDLRLTMTVTAGERSMPVVAGWHPCFRRRLDDGADLELTVAAGSMWERDAAGIPTGRLVPVPPGPWDDCFAGVVGDPCVRWPGVLELALRSACPAWVVYDQDPRLVCVEPQTDAPDAFNRAPLVLAPGERLELALALVWGR